MIKGGTRCKQRFLQGLCSAYSPSPRRVTRLRTACSASYGDQSNLTLGPSIGEEVGHDAGEKPSQVFQRLRRRKAQTLQLAICREWWSVRGRQASVRS